ncbi:TonB-dependent receptor [Sphingobium lactosutens]|nr:TonB-dependent receptor [Sphingobium lactosutens]
MNKIVLASSVAAICLLTPFTAFAQEAAVEAETQNSSEDIIVTAQRRAENVQDVPISITALNNTMLKNSNIVTIYDLPRVAPSLRVDTGIGATRARVIVRGVGSQGGTAIEPSVAGFLDGVYIPREAQMVGAYLDLQGLELLRGPQGTLFGRNASVGAINLRSALPEDTFSGNLAAEIGNGERYRTEGYVNVPISDGAALRLAGFGELNRGLWYNRLDDKHYGASDSFALRLSGKFDLSSNLSWIVRGNVARRNGNEAAMGALLTSSIPDGRLPGFLARLATIGSNDVDLTPFDHRFNQYVGDHVDDTQWGVNSTLQWDFDSGFSLKLIDAYQYWENSTALTNVFGVETPTLSDFLSYKSKSHCHELQLISPTDRLLDGRLSFVAGLYYFHESWLSDDAYQIYTDGCRLLFPAGPPGAVCPGQTNTDLFNRRFTQVTDSYAAYAQTTFKLLPTVDLVLGGRWTRDEKSGHAIQVVNRSLGANFALPEDRRLALANERFTYRTNLNWRPTDNLLFFGSYSTGYKSGGFDSSTLTGALPPAPPGTLLDRTLKPETVRSAEIGMKSELFDKLLQLNVTLFRMKVKNFQDRLTNGIAFRVVNAGDLRNQGVETDMQLRLSEVLRFNASVSYLDAVFTSYPTATALPGQTGTRDITGERPTFAPKWSGSLGAEFRHDISGGMRFLFRSDVSFVSSANINQINNADPYTVQPAYQLLSARATLYGKDDRWSVSVFGDNLTDTGYCTSYTYQALGGLLGVVDPATGRSALRCNSVSRPRSYGVRASFSF